ncbi:MAG: helix-turn-helix transcriptional regulator [Burkholderiaceae bacterium]
MTQMPYQGDGNGSAVIRLMNALHGAFADGARWAEFLSTLANVCSARHAVMLQLRADPMRPVLASCGFPDVAASQWHTYYRRVDPWLAALGVPEPGEYRVIDGEALVDDQTLRGLEIYADFLAPNDLRWLRGFWIRPDAARATPYGVLLWRGVDQTSFDRSVVETLDTVARAITAFEKVSVANALSRAAGLDGYDSAAFLLDGAGRLVMANGPGESMMMRGSVVERDGVIVPASDVAEHWLTSLLGQAASDPSVLTMAARCRERLPVIGQAHLELVGMRPIGAAPALTSWNYSLSIRAEAQAREGTVRRTAQRMYRWTNAEFDAVARLAGGESLPEIAQGRQSTIETVRSHLKNAKRKAGVHRQVDLVRIFTSLDRQ